MEDFGIRMLLSECTVGNLIHVLCPGTPLTPDKISCFSAQKPRLAQKQQHKQQQQQQQQQQTIAKPFQNLSGLGFDWLQF